MPTLEVEDQVEWGVVVGPVLRRAQPGLDQYAGAFRGRGPQGTGLPHAQGVAFGGQPAQITEALVYGIPVVAEIRGELQGTLQFPEERGLVADSGAVKLDEADARFRQLS